MMGTVPFGCGQCLPCRVNRRRQWTWRQYLESLLHDENCFITLTYAPEYLPGGGQLEPKDVQLWLKRVRKALFPKRVRYFLVGEYGENTLRPHYHLSMFGVSPFTVVPYNGRPSSFSEVVHGSWGLGHIKVDEFNDMTASYVAGYVVKKLTDVKDARLCGKHPEFARMSRRPGIGAGAMQVIATSIRQSGQWENMLRATGDVPHVFKLGKRSVPIGRYLLKKLRQEIGMTPDDIEAIKQRFSLEKSAEMSALLKDALTSSPLATARQVHLEESRQRRLQVDARAKIFKKRGTL